MGIIATGSMTVAGALGNSWQDHDTKWGEDSLIETCVKSKTSTHTAPILTFVYNSQDDDGSDMSLFQIPLAEGERCK